MICPIAGFPDDRLSESSGIEGRAVAGCGGDVGGQRWYKRATERSEHGESLVWASHWPPNTRTIVGVVTDCRCTGYTRADWGPSGAESPASVGGSFPLNTGPPATTGRLPIGKEGMELGPILDSSPLEAREGSIATRQCPQAVHHKRGSRQHDIRNAGKCVSKEEQGAIRKSRQAA